MIPFSNVQQTNHPTAVLTPTNTNTLISVTATTVTTRITTFTSIWTNVKSIRDPVLHV